MLPWKFDRIDLTGDEDKIQSYLMEKTSQHTVPNIFINQKHVGGNDNVQAAFRSGKLAELISV
ncbi:hypothetical protein L208DRAFT_1250480 [Tricholoma matsutake]|nr:hypothetical protein L208DRAFT_1250480 [Tricholoma matsutake 945]